MKKIISLTLILFLFACQQGGTTSGKNELSQGDFDKLMAKYLDAESGQDKVGKAMQAYFVRQQKKTQEARAKEQGKSLEDQFKNPIKIDVAGSPFKGPKDAKVTVVEFSDFECPFCSRGKNTMDEVLKAYPKDVKVVFKNLPLSFHKNAKPAAAAALAAGKQGKFWEMHDVLFENQKGLTAELFNSTAKKLGLNLDQFTKDMASKEVLDQIAKDEKQAASLGIGGTPNFLVNGVLVKGAYPFDHFKKLIDRWLKEAK